MLNNIVDNLEQCGQQNIVHGCFHQARTGCSFFAVYLNILYKCVEKKENYRVLKKNTQSTRNQLQ